MSHVVIQRPLLDDDTNLQCSKGGKNASPVLRRILVSEPETGGEFEVNIFIVICNGEVWKSMTFSRLDREIRNRTCYTRQVDMPSCFINESKRITGWNRFGF
ncbi:hypothetical protein KXV65_008928 [Aspergillus fumigatus]|nr:hypothetical protein KXX26_000352 [Aspergillus fumigatus]KAH1720165.1 hypothetical protein KXX60_000300 [Aspergillus fumigatus]KAH2020053.1 hypothetical protein KXV43_003050 [Aspergillus fumigatus]KAH2024812.1 hypothetical protein KXV65_008928 [Aspergillus fumigatus]KAH2239654.1 hypothetical protein KXW14_009094 [Aspergillus fumigatus]